jgi:hypothetical protein
VPAKPMITIIEDLVKAYKELEEENNQLKEQLKKYQEKEEALKMPPQVDEKSGDYPLKFFDGGQQKEEKFNKEEKRLAEKPILKLKTLTYIDNPALFDTMKNKDLKKVYELLTSKNELYTDVVPPCLTSYPLSCWLQSSERNETFDDKEFIKIINYLIDRGEDINRADSNGDTPLHWAAHNNNFDLVKYFLAKEADPSLQNNSNVLPGDERYNSSAVSNNSIRNHLNLARTKLKENLKRPPAFAPSELDGGMRWSIK